MASGNIGLDVNPNGTHLVIVQIVFLCCAWTVSLLRAFVKFFLTRQILLEDWLMLAALFLYTAYGVIAILGVTEGGTGKHTLELTPDGISTALRAWYLCEVLYVPMAALIRTSIGLFLLRLVVLGWHIWLIRANLVVIWVVSIVYFFLMLLQCQPISYFWQGPVTPGLEGSCINPLVVPVSTIVHSAVSAITDWVLAVIPLLMLWNVLINRRTKIVIACLLSMGFVAGIAMIIRIPYTRQIAVSADFLYQTIDLAIWAVIEPGLGIIAGCLASLRPLFKSMGFGLSGAKRYASKANYGSKPQWYSLSRNVKKLDDRSGDSKHLGLTGSETDLRQQSEIFSTQEHHSNRSGSPTFRVQNGISVETSIDIVSHPESDVAERSSDEDRTLTRDLASHGGMGLLSAPPPSHGR